ncbi:MAG: PHP domain-containing protein [Clostridia bacterium]|nr:PHP domain-containing protein [Clostridia bacterium]
MDICNLLQIIDKTDVTADERLEALKGIKELIDKGEITRDGDGSWVNNHIHTCYSFSPYTPTSAIFYAWKAGLGTAGIMDHDSVGGIKEFIKAGEIMGMPVTCGFECRVNVAGTALEGRRINNPDQNSCAYLAMHGIPHQSVDAAAEVLEGIRAKRNERNRKMCEKITELVSPYGIKLDFDRDVYPISMAHEGGSITERHILFALTKKITARYPDREEACDFIEKMTSPLGKTREKLITAPDNFYEYDILGVLKGHMVVKFYIPAEDELMHISEFTALAKKLGAISAYAYLGDVGESPTGDKKAQKFEDDYLDDLFDTLKEQSFSAVTYMPSRNTAEQLAEIMRRCDEKGLFQISGEDINSPRQSFICKALGDPKYAHLKVATYALIGHENAATECICKSMFSDATAEKMPAIADRVEYFAHLGGLN